MGHQLNAFGYMDMYAFGENYKNSVNTKENMQNELLLMVEKYKPPFRFDFSSADDDDEESGNAWVF